MHRAREAGVLVGVHVLWYLATDVFGVSRLFLPSPIATYRNLFLSIQESVFWLDVGMSSYRVGVAFALSCMVSYALVVLGAYDYRIRGSLLRAIEFLRYLPVPVFVPLTILWFGVSDLGKIMIIFLGTFTQMVVMFNDSLDLVQGQYQSTRFALRWDDWKYVRRVVLPGAGPHLFDNARVCLGWAWTYLVVAELLGAEHGIGYAIIRAQRFLSTEKIFAYVIVIGVLGVVSDYLMRKLKAHAFKWY